jgi:hypothetical protein
MLMYVASLLMILSSISVGYAADDGRSVSNLVVRVLTEWLRANGYLK